MKNKIIFFGLLFAQNMFAGARGEEHDLIQSCLKLHGGNVKICLKLIKNGYQFTDKEKDAMDHVIKLYLSTLVEYHYFIKEGWKKFDQKK